MIQILANGLCSASVICLMALGFGLIYAANRVLHIAHAAVFTFGAYAAYLTTSISRFPLAISALASITASVVLGVLIEIVVYGPLVKRKASGNVILISSLGTQIVIVNLIAIVFGSDKKVLRPGVEETLHIGDIVLTTVQVGQLIVAGIVLVGFYLILFRTHFGRLGRALADNATLASVLGIDVRRTRLLVTVCGSSLAGLAAFMASMTSGADPNMGFPVVLSAAVACIIGGLGKFLAPALGALIIGLLESLTIWFISAKWSSAATFAMLIIFILARPYGILGVRRRLSES